MTIENGPKIEQDLAEQKHISHEHPDFQGHFPNFPLLPAVSQIDLVLDLISAHCGARVVCVGVERAKFRAMLKPETQVSIQVYGAGEAKARWIVRDDTSIYSQGLLQLAWAL